MATLSSRLESLEREGSETSVFGEMSPHTRAMLARLRDSSLPVMECNSAVRTNTVTLPSHTRRFVDEMRAQWIAAMTDEEANARCTR